MTKQIPLETGIFSWPPDCPGHPYLIGSRCTNCGNHTFPAQSGCPKCAGAETEVLALSRRGTLWTWTVQAFPPKSPPFRGAVDPTHFQPFGVGYVELPGQVKVEARLTEVEFDALTIGMELELVLIPLTTDDDGNDVMTFAFRPLDPHRPNAQLLEDEGTDS